MNTAARQKIVNRTGPCRCGCRGQDSQHPIYFVRTIRNIRWNHEAKTTDVFGVPVIEAAILGEARFPWGIETVAATLYKSSTRWIDGGWKRIR